MELIKLSFNMIVLFCDPVGSVPREGKGGRVPRKMTLAMAQGNRRHLLLRQRQLLPRVWSAEVPPVAEANKAGVFLCLFVTC